MKTQSETVAEIATSITDKPIPTAAEILVALNKAYQAGFAHGAIRGQTHMSNIFDKVFRTQP